MSGPTKVSHDIAMRSRVKRLVASWLFLLGGGYHFLAGPTSLEEGHLFLVALIVISDIFTGMFLKGKSSRVSLVPALALVVWAPANTLLAVGGLAVGGLFVAVLSNRPDLQTAVDFSYSLVPIMACGLARQALPDTPFMTLAVWEAFVVLAVIVGPSRPAFRLNLLGLLAAPALALGLQLVWQKAPSLTLAFVPSLLALALVPEDDFKIVRKLRAALDRSRVQLLRESSMRQRKEEQVEQLAVLLKACNALVGSLDTQQLRSRLLEGVRALLPDAKVRIAGPPSEVTSFHFQLDARAFVQTDREISERERRALELLSRVWSTTLENARLHQELKEALEQTRISQAQMVGSMRMADMGRLAAGVAHEVNTPLGAIRLAAEYAKGQLEKNPARAHKRLEEILRSTENATASVQRLLFYTRGGHVEKVLESFDPAQVVRDAVEMLEFRVRRADAEVLLELPAGLMLSGYRSDFYSLVSNLLLNALEAVSGREQRKVCITIEPQVGGGGGGLQLTVDDSGRGVSEEMRDEIFKPFVTTQPEGEGTGLGLWLCANIVQQHGGGISIQHGPLGGARFQVVLAGIAA